MGSKVDDYIAGLSGWQAEVASTLRRQILAVGGISENFKWGQPVFETDKGPVCLIRAHKAHISFGFWRGQQMEDPANRFVPIGSFKMADIKLKGPEIAGDEVRRLVEKGISLNEQYGDPLKDAKS